MTTQQTLNLIKSWDKNIEAGVPKAHVISQAKKHIQAVTDFTEDSPARAAEIADVKTYITQLQDAIKDEANQQA